MSNVYFKRIRSGNNTKDVSKAAKSLLNKLVKEEFVILEDEIPLKVHFGEKGNETYIKPQNFEGILEFLEENKIKSSYIETNVLYRGERTHEADHKQLAVEHGFTQLPIIIADGEIGENYEYVKINKKYFKKCKIGKEFSKFKQIIVISHFKGHMLAGFGGAIKQLSMGCAARGGKLDMHANSHPLINPIQCKKCHKCEEHCPVHAINIGSFSKINTDRCIGCAACIAICPYGAIKINWAAALTNHFHEKLAEYAFAAQLGKKNIYITFALNITKECDCIGHAMKPMAPDIGVFASLDPVAIDQVCLDMLEEEGKMFTGEKTISHAEEIGLGSADYTIIEI